MLSTPQPTLQNFDSILVRPDVYERGMPHAFSALESEFGSKCVNLGDMDQTLLAFLACSAYNICMQYTIRNVPDTLDQALRRAAREQGRSLNEVAIEALARGAGVSGECGRQRDLSDIAGTWHKDPAFDSALAAQDTIDEGLWR